MESTESIHSLMGRYIRAGRCNQGGIILQHLWYLHEFVTKSEKRQTTLCTEWGKWIDHIQVLHGFASADSFADSYLGLGQGLH